jgi:hypothetical protein
MALSLRDVRCDPIANRALNELMHHYTVAQEKSRLVLTKKIGDMKRRQLNKSVRAGEYTVRKWQQVGT